MWGRMTEAVGVVGGAGGGVAVHTLQLTVTGNINNRAEQTGWGYTC